MHVWADEVPAIEKRADILCRHLTEFSIALLGPRLVDPVSHIPKILLSDIFI